MDILTDYRIQALRIRECELARKAELVRMVSEREPKRSRRSLRDFFGHGTRSRVPLTTGAIMTPMTGPIGIN